MGLFLLFERDLTFSAGFQRFQFENISKGGHYLGLFLHFRDHLQIPRNTSGARRRRNQQDSTNHAARSGSAVSKHGHVTVGSQMDHWSCPVSVDRVEFGY